MSQSALPFDWPADEEADSFIVAPSNETAVRHLESHARWPVRATVLVGPRKSGRSLLGRVFARRTGGRLIEDAEAVPELELFRAWNEAQDRKKPLLLIADQRPTDWTIKVPDLRSRLAATPVVELSDPDDGLIARLLARLLERRGVVIPREVVAYLVPRVPRSHVAILRLVEALDAGSLAQRRTLTVPFARQVLNGLWDTERGTAVG